MDEQCVKEGKYMEAHDAAIVLGVRATYRLLEAFPDNLQMQEIRDVNETLLNIVHDNKLHGGHYGTRNLCEFYDHCKAILNEVDEGAVV